MAVELNHIIVPARDKWVSARFVASILGLREGPQWGPFVPIRVGNGVTIDYVDSTQFQPHHCAFLVSDEEFDAAFARIRKAGISFYADFSRQRRGEINTLYGGRGVYFDDPSGHLLELITRPYGAQPEM